MHFALRVHVYKYVLMQLLNTQFTFKTRKCNPFTTQCNVMDFETADPVKVL